MAAGKECRRCPEEGATEKTNDAADVQSVLVPVAWAGNVGSGWDEAGGFVSSIAVLVLWLASTSGQGEAASLSGCYPQPSLFFRERFREVGSVTPEIVFEAKSIRQNERSRAGRAETILSA